MALFDIDNWREIGNALTSNMLRTVLTALGVFWGIFMLVLMLGSGNGLENGVTQNYAGEATNSFYVWARSTTVPYRGLPTGRRFDLNNRDTEAIRQQVPEVEVVAPTNQLGGYRGGNNVTRGVKAGAFNVMGDYPQILEVQAVRMTGGRFIDPLDIAERRKVAVIGSRVAEVLFEPGEDPIGQSIRINGVYFKVIGYFESMKPGEGSTEDAQRISIPFTTFQQAFNYGDRVGWYAITARSGVPASVAEEKVLSVLRKRHRIAGIGTLTAGVIGVSNIMLVIVRERTHEIGIRRALGATPLSIVGQIVLEAILLTSTAGYLGLVAGMVLVELAARFVTGAQMFINPYVSTASALQALAILVVAGTVAGLIPATRAIAISPVQALRSEG
jgi:putative ABC transport system permease protein